MTGVVLRCGNCGTVQATGGECEACHEAQVAFFCTNHDPGRWLGASNCPGCGARFGEAVSAAPIPPGPGKARPPVDTAPPPVRQPIEARPDRPRVPVATEEEMVRERAARLREWLDAAVRTSRTRMRPRTLDAEGLPIGRAVGGCVRTLMFLAVLLLAIVIFGSLLLGGAVIQIL